MEINSEQRPSSDIRIHIKNDVIMSTIASQITSLTIVYSIVYLSAYQRKYQRPAILAFVWGIHRRPVNSPHKGPVRRKMFPFDDIIMRLRHDTERFPERSQTPWPSCDANVMYTTSMHEYMCVGVYSIKHDRRSQAVIMLTFGAWYREESPL